MRRSQTRRSLSACGRARAVGTGVDGAFVGSQAAWGCFESPKRVKRCGGQTHQAGNPGAVIGLCELKLVDPDQNPGPGEPLVLGWGSSFAPLASRSPPRSPDFRLNSQS